MRKPDSLTQALENLLATWDATPRADKLRPKVAELREAFTAFQAKRQAAAKAAASSPKIGRPKIDRSAIVRMHGQAFTPIQIAKAVGVSVSTVRNVIKETTSTPQ